MNIQSLFSSNIENYIDYDLSKISSFKIGGKADIVFYPKNENEFVQIIKTVIDNKIKFKVIGNASNVLFSDEGYHGAIIFTKKMSQLILSGDEIFAECGVALNSISNLALNNSLSGFEFAHGIPGTLGGAVFMNAGAYGAQMSDVVISSKVYNIDTEEFNFIDNKDHNFTYRKSIFSKNKNLICLSTNIKLSYGDKDKIASVIKENTTNRREKQPLNFPNCGSFFKHPEGHFAGKLIEDCNLKGFSVGGAQVSPKHAGFIVNTGNATASDVLMLADHIKKTVFKKFGVILETEVEYIT